jgi:trimethylamine--corrinoid protein Co-methyltransferase
MRPKLRLLDDSLIERIVAEARGLLCTLGVEIHNTSVLSMLGDRGAQIEVPRQRARLSDEIIDRALASVPSSFQLFDALGDPTHDFSGDNVHFTPGSTAINILDGETGKIRKPDTRDYIRYAKLVAGLPHLAAQSTAFIPADVHESISDSYRLFLSLLYCEKPVVTGAFTIEGYEVLKNLQLAVRGNAEQLARKPLAVLSCCPTSPLKWSDVTSQNVIDCAQHSIPVEFVSMPLSGFMAPVTLVGTLIQHTAETLSGVVISQLTRPGTPVLYGGSPAIFDVRHETTPMGAVETMMIDCAYSEIGKSLGMPTQGYVSLSDAKQLDAQAGLESGMGAALAALSGINNVSGPGMLDFESCQSLEKLVLDDEICGMVFRLLRGVEPKGDFPALPLFQEFLREKHLLIADHTRRYLRDEIGFPGPVIDRATRSQWMEKGGLTLKERAAREVQRVVQEARPSRLPNEVKRAMIDVMEGEARRCGMDSLPPREKGDVFD